MLRRYSINFELFSILLDVVSVISALVFAQVVHPWLEPILPFLKQDGQHGLPRLYYIVFPIFWAYLHLGLSLYDGRRNVRYIDEMYRLVFAALIAFVSLAGFLFFVSADFSHSVFVSIILIAAAMMWFWRSLIRLYWRRQYSNKHELRKVLIVGSGATGRQIASHFLPPPASNLEIVGYLDDDPAKFQKDKDVLGTTNDLERVVSFYHVNILIVALPSTAFTLTANIVERLRMKPIRIWIAPVAQRLALNHCAVENFAGIPLIDIRAPSISEEQRLLKRVFDLVFASVVILISAPLMLIVAILIKLDSSGPVFFRQMRVGENTQPFEMLKFRTMIQNAEALCASIEKLDKNGNVIHKHRNDPRVTRIGYFLRRFSIDELPQVFNILLGKMSVVGPRPELPHLVEKYKSWQYVRFTIPQGLTGWWQVTGRSDKPMHLNTEDDLYYIKNYCLWLDIKIILKTFAVVIGGRGAF